MKNFCVIDIGTNAVKIKIFSDGRYVSLRNKPISQINNNVSKDDILHHVQDFIHEAEDGYQVSQNQIYLYATEGVRHAPDGKLIQQELEQKTKRKLHVLDPKREARLSALGGLSSIELKNNPKQVLYIESGGGSTEFSLLDMSVKPFGVIASQSLPVGSRDGKKRLTQYAAFDDFCKEVRKKGAVLGDSTQVVINSGAAARLIAKRYKYPAFRPAALEKNQNSISLKDFMDMSRRVLVKKDYDEAFCHDYFLTEGLQEGFVGHVNVLNHILKNLKQHDELKMADALPITMTLGGLKDGIAQEIEYNYSQGNENLNVGETIAKGEKVFNSSDVIDKSYAAPLRQFYKDVAQKENEEYAEDEKSTEFHAVLKRQNGDNLHIYSKNTQNVDLQLEGKNGKKKIPEYSDFNNLVLYAKQKGQKISFGSIKSHEFRARLYLACLENKVEVKNTPEIDYDKIDTKTMLMLKKAQFQNKEKTTSKKKTNSNMSASSSQRLSSFVYS